MKCFHHSAVDAVAVCKACSRALCHACLTLVDGSCSCRGRCESDVAAMNELVERGRSAYQKTSAAYSYAGIFSAIFGTIFAALGLLAAASEETRAMGAVLALFGLVFAGYGVAQLVTARRMRQK